MYSAFKDLSVTFFLKILIYTEELGGLIWKSDDESLSFPNPVSA